MRFVFVMDPIDRVVPDRDTSYAFAASATARGHECWHCLIHDVEHVGERVTARVRRLAIGTDPAIALRGPLQRIALADVDAVFIRKDPPFDPAYWHATLLLDSLRGTTLVLNDPRGLREANEKLYTLSFRRWMPRTIVSADPAAIFAFIDEVGGRGVIKPVDGAGGFGVMAVQSGEHNARAIVELHTQEGKQLAVVQEYLPQVAEGDKRVLLLDGEPLGAIMRLPQDGDLRANIHVGAEVRPSELSPTERAAVEDMAPRLRADGLVFVGLDFIGDKLTEVNVTSPTGIQELGRFSGTRPADRVIEWVERQAAVLPAHRRPFAAQAAPALESLKIEN